MTHESTKAANNLVFVGLATSDGNMTPKTRELWNLFQPDGVQIGRWRFIARTCQSFSTAKARNILTALARDCGAAKLLMVDSDMVAGPAHLERILSHDEMLVGGVYPRKNISLTQQWVLNWEADAKTRPDGLAPVMDIGAGFLCVDMKLVDQMIERWPRTLYLSEDAPWTGEEMFDLWSEGVVDDVWRKGAGNWPRYLTEDFYFCWRARKLGYTVFADTLCTCGHLGQADYLLIMELVAKLTATQTAGNEASPDLPPIVR